MNSFQRWVLALGILGLILCYSIPPYHTVKHVEDPQLYRSKVVEKREVDNQSLNNRILFIVAISGLIVLLGGNNSKGKSIVSDIKDFGSRVRNFFLRHRKIFRCSLYIIGIIIALIIYIAFVIFLGFACNHNMKSWLYFTFIILGILGINRYSSKDVVKEFKSIDKTEWGLRFLALFITITIFILSFSHYKNV